MSARISISRQRRSGAAWVWILLLIIVAAIAVWAYWATRPRPAVVEVRDIEGRLVLGGTAVSPPSAIAHVGAPFRAPVDRVFVSAGSNVKRGDPLVELRYPAGQAALQQAEANLRAAESAYARGQQMNATNLPALKWQLDAARAAYEQAKAGASIGEVRSPMTGTVLEVNAVPGEEVGRDISVPLATVADLSRLQVHAPMEPEDAVSLKPGTPVTLTFAQIPGHQFEGKISQITSAKEKKLAGLVREDKRVAIIDFKNVEPLARPGMTASVEARLGRVENALVVPSKAIQVDATGQPTVAVKRGGEWNRVAVQTGVTDGIYTQVRSGLKKGEVVQVPRELVEAAPLPRR